MGSGRSVKIAGLSIGGRYPVRVESMLKTPLSDISGCLTELQSLVACGCELVRTALPDVSLAQNLKILATHSEIPLMADIHFNYKLAVAALETGCPSIRINPGNMTGSGLSDVIGLARDKGAVIRIGANGGSLSNRQLEQTNGDRGSALVLAVEEQVRLLRDHGFEDVIISAKSSNIMETVRANVLLAEKYDYPIHIGITEAGPGLPGVVKGSAGIALMLGQGVGDTIRVSLTSPGTDEVKTGYHILRALGIRSRGVDIISCPTCGRKRVDVLNLVELVEAHLPDDLPEGFSVAVMGCEVNGPREAAGADLGVAGTQAGFVLFKKGIPCGSGKKEDLPEMLAKALADVLQANAHS